MNKIGKPDRPITNIKLFHPILPNYTLKYSLICFSAINQPFVVHSCNCNKYIYLSCYKRKIHIFHNSLKYVFSRKSRFKQQQKRRKKKLTKHFELKIIHFEFTTPARQSTRYKLRNWSLYDSIVKKGVID